MTINIPAKKYVKLLNEMDKENNGWDAADVMHRVLQKYMAPGSYDEYLEEYYGNKQQ